ncbi:MAG TPA: hypothetical protein PKC91_01970 [Ignavibacteria bacterium]|nr:hypothetical protein [Ignavibacteria bacterium]
MKNITKQVITLFFILLFLSPAYSQSNYFNYTEWNISFWYPDNWLVREHILLLLMPKSEDLQIRFEITNTVDLKGAVKESLIDLKSLYPDDTLFIIKDYVINKLKVKEIDGIIQSKKINYLLLETPENKIIRVSYISPKDIALKYNDDIQKILKSLKPID